MSERKTRIRNFIHFARSIIVRCFTGKLADEMREQLHNDVRQTGRAHVFGRPGRGTELRNLSGIHVIPETQLVSRSRRAAVHERVVGRGQLDPAGQPDLEEAQRLR